MPPQVTPTDNWQSIWQYCWGWSPTELQQSQFEQLYAQLLIGNQQFNLTRITALDEFLEKHIWDSLSGIMPWLNPTTAENAPTSVKRVIDIGTGGGFPGIPVAIAMPHWHLTLLDSTRKKMQFLEALGPQLKLDLHCITERAEALGRDPDHRAQHDLALIRAVSSASACVEYALPFVRMGGIAILYRGQWSEQDTTNLEPALSQIGGELMEIKDYKTPLTQGARHCLYVKKVKKTDRRFPRKIGVPAKEPI